MARADYLELMAQRVQDTDSRLSVDDHDRALRAAVIKYSKDSPLSIVTDIAANGSNLLTLPDGFDPLFSRVSGLEYPVGNYPPTLLDSGSYQLLQIPGGYALAVHTCIPIGQMVWMTWTQMHTVDALHDTIHAAYRDAVADWAASLLCHDLATLYSGDSDPTISADSVDHNGKAREFAARSRTLAQRYWDALGIDPKKNNAHGEVVNLSVTPSHGTPHLTHRRGFYRGG